MDLGASVPTKQPLEVVQPAKGALDNTGSAEVGAVFGLGGGAWLPLCHRVPSRR
jgi:hypothetical protein